MKPFLYQIADLFYQKYGTEIHNLAFVFPNRRAGLFFQKYLSEISERPLFSPSILTINDLFMQLAGKQQIDRIRLLFKLYGIYVRRSGSTESFDEFLYWGEMLLNDFDDIDKYMVDARLLFRNVTDLKQLDDGFDFLSDEQIQAIRTFWSSFYPKSDTPNQQHFLELWEVLFDLYTELRETLAAEGGGYEGMIFREVVESLEQEPVKDFPYSRIVFVGLNALSVSEERLLLALQKKGIADFYWDYVSPYVRDRNNKASFFVERNLELFPSSMQLPAEEDINREIRVIGVPSAIGQAKQVYHLLDSYLQKEELTEASALRTAVVLPEEHLLIPVLNSIPESIHPINVTMGYPLAGTPVASLMEYILTLQKNLRFAGGQPIYYYRDVLPILNHQYVAANNPKLIADMVSDFTRKNRIYIEAKELEQNELLSVLFSPVSNASQLSDYLIRILEALNGTLCCDEGDESEPDDEGQTLSDVEQEFVFHYFATVNRMKEVMAESNVEMRLDTYFRLLKRMADLITIPFEGEPLSGLQVMGVLETRALDFDRLIILSMNEGIFPKKKVANSFIPYNLRRGFGLPTYEHQDSVWAYHFYRLIQRSKEVTLLYDTRSDMMLTGEVSRFVHQLRYHYQVPLLDQLVVYDVASAAVPPIVVEKTDEVMQKLNAFRRSGERALSASAINTYLDCPVKFYYSSVERIEEEDEISETVESDAFGSIFHRVMEVLYAPFCGKQITADLLKKILKDKNLIDDTISHAFAELFFKSADIRPLVGENYLIAAMIRKYVENILEKDIKSTPFVYVQSEKRIDYSITLTDGTHVNLKGFIDRIDIQKNDVLRIIDYKTGDGILHFKSVPELFDKQLKKRSKAVMQVFLYCWVYMQLEKCNNRYPVQPSIIYLRKIFEEKFQIAVQQNVGGRKYENVESFSDLFDEFEEAFRTCLDEIFNPSLPFYQTEITEHCSYCNFKELCGR